jgi:hypothetical protein
MLNQVVHRVTTALYWVSDVQIRRILGCDGQSKSAVKRKWVVVACLGLDATRGGAPSWGLDGRFEASCCKQ